MLGSWALVLLVHLLPRLVLGDRSVVLVHDNLDSDFLYRVLINRQDRLFDFSAQVPELIGGLPRSIFPSALKLSSLLFAVLPSFWAYVTLELCVRSLAFSGMYFLIRDHVPIRPSQGQVVLIAATFATLPFYVIYDASVAGQAWVAWALLNLWHTRRIRASMLALLAYPFVSVLATSGAFVIAGAAIVAGIAALVARRFPWWVLAGGVALVLGHLASDYWFIRVMVAPPYVSHRSVWMQPGSSQILDTAGLIARTATTFVYGRYHSASLHTCILIGTLVTAVFSVWHKRWRDLRWMLGILGAAALLSLTHGLSKWRGFEPLWELIPFLRMVNMRFHWSLPTLWFVALALVAGIWAHRMPRSYWLYAALVLNLAWVVKSGMEGNAELLPNYQLMLGQRPIELSYREFVAERLFARIDHAIGAPKNTYHVVSIGLEPSIAALNGFQCADGYHDNYPLTYKQRYVKLVAGELQRDSERRRYVQEWGSRAYVFPAHTRVLSNRSQLKKHLSLDTLSLDREALHELDIKYIFSAYKLRGDALAGLLRPRGDFTDAEAAWHVYLYEVVPH